MSKTPPRRLSKNVSKGLSSASKCDATCVTGKRCKNRASTGRCHKHAGASASAPSSPGSPDIIEMSPTIYHYDTSDVLSYRGHTPPPFAITPPSSPSPRPTSDSKKSPSPRKKKVKTTPKKKRAATRSRSRSKTASPPSHDSEYGFGVWY